MKKDWERGVDRTVGQTIRDVREGLKLTQAELAGFAQGLGLAWDRSTIAAIERGSRGLSVGEFVLIPRLLASAGAEWDLFVVEFFMTLDHLDLPPLDADEVDREMARRFGVSAKAFRHASIAKWGRSLTQERDARCVSFDGSRRSLQAHRGHVTRDLINELGLDA